MERKMVSDTYYCILCEMLHEAIQVNKQRVIFHTGFYRLGQEIYLAGYCQNDLNQLNNRSTTENDISDV